MPLNRTLFRIDVTETDQDRNFWAARPGLTPGTVAKIRAAEIVVVPWQNRGKESSETVPTGTIEFLKELKRELSSDTLAVATEPDAYMELSLHADEMRWPTFLVSSIALPVLLNLLANQIDRAISATPPPATVEVKIVVENEHGKCISVDYKGPPGRLVESLVAETAHCLPKADKTEAKVHAKSG
jgi:hypothetical protein